MLISSSVLVRPNPVAEPFDGSGVLRLSEVVAALSYALDVTDGQPAGHAIRTCLIGMRIADELGLEIEQRSALFYGMLLKDAGCSSNASKITALYGVDDLEAKSTAKLINHSRAGEALGYILRTARGPAALARVLRAGSHGARQLTEIRCERGAEIARMLGLPEETAEAIYSLDEHWDGKGHPRGLAGEEIPLLSRILGLSQTVEVFHANHDLGVALTMADARTGTWFDPELVRILHTLRGDTAFWAGLSAPGLHHRIAALEPIDSTLRVEDARLDGIAEAFAKVIDAKSPYTFAHSDRVAGISVVLAGKLGIEGAELRDLRRAALLHDLGKLAISNTILDKPGKLDDHERRLIRAHPRLTQEILERISQFSGIAEVAGAPSRAARRHRVPPRHHG